MACRAPGTCPDRYVRLSEMSTTDASPRSSAAASASGADAPPRGIRSSPSNGGDGIPVSRGCVLRYPPASTTASRHPICRSHEAVMVARTPSSSTMTTRARERADLLVRRLDEAGRRPPSAHRPGARPRTPRGCGRRSRRASARRPRRASDRGSRGRSCARRTAPRHVPPRPGPSRGRRPTGSFACSVAPFATSRPARCQAMVPLRRDTTRLGTPGVDERLRPDDAAGASGAVHDDGGIRRRNGIVHAVCELRARAAYAAGDAEVREFRCRPAVQDDDVLAGVEHRLQLLGPKRTACRIRARRLPRTPCSGR